MLLGWLIENKIGHAGFNSALYCVLLDSCRFLIRTQGDEYRAHSINAKIQLIPSSVKRRKSEASRFNSGVCGVSMAL